MAKNPAFPFYVNDFEGGTTYMTDAELGCYVRLLLAQFNSKDGTLPANEKFLERYCESFKSSWPVVNEKFKKINSERIQNERMETERVKRLLFVNHQSENAKKRGQRKATADPPQSHGTPNDTANVSSNASTNDTPIAMPLGYGYGKGDYSEGKRGMGGEETEIGHPANGFFIDSLDSGSILTETQVGSVIVYIELTCKVTLTENEICERWEAFKIQNFSSHDWYNSYEKLLTHFRNSIKLDIQKNGTAYKQSVNGIAGKKGTSAARVEALRKW